MLCCGAGSVVFSWSAVCSGLALVSPATRAGSAWGSGVSQVLGSWGLPQGPVLWLSFHFLIAVAQDSVHGLSGRLGHKPQVCGVVTWPLPVGDGGLHSGSAFPSSIVGSPGLSAFGARSFRGLSLYSS